MRRSLWVALLAVAVSIVVAGSVLASHAPGGVTPVLLARGRLSEQVKVNFGDIKIQTKGPVDVATVQVTLRRAEGAPAGTSIPGRSSW